MSTYTTTKVLTRPNTSVEWPSDSAEVGDNSLLFSGSKISSSKSLSDDDLTLTITIVWSSKEDYDGNQWGTSGRSAELQQNVNNCIDYMTTNNMTSKITKEDGSVVIFPIP